MVLDVNVTINNRQFRQRKVTVTRRNKISVSRLKRRPRNVSSYCNYSLWYILFVSSCRCHRNPRKNSHRDYLFNKDFIMISWVLLVHEHLDDVTEKTSFSRYLCYQVVHYLEESAMSGGLFSYSSLFTTHYYSAPINVWTTSGRCEWNSFFHQWGTWHTRWNKSGVLSAPSISEKRLVKWPGMDNGSICSYASLVRIRCSFIQRHNTSPSWWQSATHYHVLTNFLSPTYFSFDRHKTLRRSNKHENYR